MLRTLLRKKKQVRSDNDASELVILGQFKRLFDEFGTLEGGRWGILQDSDRS